MGQSDEMVTRLESSSLDFQTAMLRMDVAREIRRLYGDLPDAPQPVDREKVKSRLLESYQELDSAPSPRVIDEAIEAFLASSYRFQPPSEGLDLTLARWYIRRREIGYKVGIPVLVAVLFIAAIWRIDKRAAERQAYFAELETERLIGELLQTHSALEEQLDHFSESPQIPTLPKPSHAAFYDHLDRAENELDAARGFVEDFDGHGDIEVRVTPTNYLTVSESAENARQRIASADEFLEQARDLLELEEGLVTISEALESSIETLRNTDPPAPLAERAESTYSQAKAHVSARRLNEARSSRTALAELAQDAVDCVRLEREADRLYLSIRAVAAEAAAENRVRELHAQAERLFSAGDVDRLHEWVRRLAELGTQLDQEYRLVIVGGVWRFENNNPSVRNYYLRVQALDSYGKALELLIRNEETGQSHTVREWAERVPKDVYDRVGADKADNGLIDDDLFGEKSRGYLTAERRFPNVGQITNW